MKPSLAGRFVLAAITSSAKSAMVWSGLDYTFTKADYADWTLPDNQDAITPGVIITRQDTQGIYNVVLESFFSDWGASPLDTEWAFSGQGTAPNPLFNAGEGAVMYTQLTFENWTTAVDYYPAYYMVDVPAVVHLISEDIYIDILFTQWTSGGGGGGFSYMRGVPAPTSLALLGLGGLALRRRR